MNLVACGTPDPRDILLDATAALEMERYFHPHSTDLEPAQTLAIKTLRRLYIEVTKKTFLALLLLFCCAATARATPVAFSGDQISRVVMLDSMLADQSSVARDTRRLEVPEPRPISLGIIGAMVLALGTAMRRKEKQQVSL